MKKGHIYLPEVVIDTHCHGRDMEQAHKTTVLQTLSEANESGVDITFFMPNTQKPIIDIPTLKLYIKIIKEAEKKLGLGYQQKVFFGITDSNLSQCDEALRFNEVVGLKDYPMSRTGKTMTTGTIGVRFKKTRLAGMKLVRKYDKVYARHCSNPESNEIDSGDSIRAEFTDVLETISIAERIHGAKIIVCHVSCQASAEIILSAQKGGLKIAIEICPHYLVFSGDGLYWNPKLHPVFYWCFNNLRSRLDLEYLQMLLATSFDNPLIFTASDNAPHTWHEKLESVKRGKWIGGISSNRHLLPTMITLAKLYNWTYGHLARLISWNAANFYGIKVPNEPIKCSIEFRKDTGAYNNGIVENPWSHLKLWYPAERKINS